MQRSIKNEIERFINLDSEGNIMKSKHLGLISVLVLLTTVVLPIASWIPVVKISTHPDNIVRDDNYPQIAVDSSGNSYIAWYGYDGNDYEIYWVKVDPAGTPGSVVKISTHPDNTGRYDGIPQIAVDASGTSYVTWEGWSASNKDIYWVKVDSAGTPGSVVKISTHPDNTRRADSLAQIAVDASGNSYVVWQGYDGNDNEIYWVKVNPAGVPGSVVKISTHPDNTGKADWYPQIAVDASGNSYIVWQGHDGNDYEIYWVRIDISSSPGTVQKISTHPCNITWYDYTPQIAVDASGNSYVVWKGYDGHDLEIFWTEVDALGVPGTVKIISTHPGNVNASDESPQIAVDASGNSYVVWYSNKVYWVKVDPIGTPGAIVDISAPHHVSRFTLSPQIAVTPSGHSYVTWRSYDGSNLDIYWAVIISGILGAVEKVSTHADNLTRHDYFSQIAVDASGTSYVTWHGYDGNDLEIYFSLNSADSVGPETSHIQAMPNPSFCTAPVALTAIIDDSAAGASKIQAAEYFINTTREDGTGIPMRASDSVFDSPTEVVVALIDVSWLSPGLHTLYVHGQDARGNWGTFQSVSLEVMCHGFTEISSRRINEQIRPLAQYSISEAEELLIEAQKLISWSQEKNFDTSECEMIIENAKKLLRKAQECFRGGNYIAANIQALEAIETFKEAIECLSK